MSTPLNFAYFGGEPLGVPVLEELKLAGLTPSLVVCNPDRPSGRGQKLTPPPVKVWADTAGIEVYQPTSYQDEAVKEKLNQTDWDVFVVVAYNFILPDWLLEIPKQGVVNLHPSLLPKLRGASPIRTAIKDDLREDVGVTIMKLDQQMDHGPIIDQRQLVIAAENWPIAGPELDDALAHLGGALLADTLPAYLKGELALQTQDHDAATYCGRLAKTDRELTIDPLELPVDDAAWQAWLTINAFAGIGDTFFVYEGTRVKINQATLTSGNLHLVRVTPEGKKTIDFLDYLKTLT